MTGEYKVAVVSDSHGRPEYLRRVVETEHPQAFLFLGDGLFDAEVLARDYPMLPLYTVPGNCDWGSVDEPEKLIELAGVRILMMHGHTRQVKYSPMNAYYAAREMGAQVVMFGHTHIPLVDYDGQLYTLNPGSIRFTGTYGILRLRDGQVLECTTRKIT